MGSGGQLGLYSEYFPAEKNRAARGGDRDRQIGVHQQSSVEIVEIQNSVFLHAWLE